MGYHDEGYLVECWQDGACVVKHAWGICQVGDFFMPARAFNWSGMSEWSYMQEYGTMSYEEAHAISKLLNATNQGECNHDSE